MFQTHKHRYLSIGALLGVFLIPACIAQAQQVLPPVANNAPIASDTEKSLSVPHLRGDELLCEIETDTYSGVFALDTQKANPLPFPLVRNARAPQWSPTHKVWSFTRAGLIWVGDLEGHIQPAGLIPRYAQNFQMFWDARGKAFAIYDVPGWARVLARSINFSEELVVQRLKEHKGINLKFAERIITKPDSSDKGRILEVEDGSPPKKIEWPLSPVVNSTIAAALSPDASQFVLEVKDQHSSLHDTGSHLWLLRSVEFSGKDSLEEYKKFIAENDYSRFYVENSLTPNVAFVKELTGKSKNIFQSQPVWSPDGKMLAYTQTNLTAEEVWPHVLMGENLQTDVAVSIPDYLPFLKAEQWAKKSVEVLFWGADGDLYLIQGTRSKIYRAKKTGDKFMASVFIEINAGGTSTILHPVLRGEWLAHTMSLDDAMTVHLKNTITGEERNIRLAVNGSGHGVVRSLNW